MTESPDTLLAPLRARIDAVDRAIVGLLAERIETVREVIDIKQRNGIPARLNDRVETVVRQVRSQAEARHCPPDLAEQVWRAMIEWTIAFEERHLPAGAAEASPEQDK